MKNKNYYYFLCKVSSCLWDLIHGSRCPARGLIHRLNVGPPPKLATPVQHKTAARCVLCVTVVKKRCGPIQTTLFYTIDCSGGLINDKKHNPPLRSNIGTSMPYALSVTVHTKRGTYSIDAISHPPTAEFATSLVLSLCFLGQSRL